MRAKTPAEIEIMREAGQKLARILQATAKKVVPGVTPKELTTFVAEQIKAAGLRPALLGYEGFADVMCVSINQGIVHGLPGKKPIKDGDVVKLDLTVGYKNLVLDSAISVYAGNTEPPADIKRLLEGTQRALAAGIEAIKGD
ncbi:MAG TPA: M24 family metallopeptidase, partial [Candidatus Saccharimonadales bacterium]|nr:M24 family metallopeptidase [Candidatus Saccharimonadales bacterium]